MSYCLRTVWVTGIRVRIIMVIELWLTVRARASVWCRGWVIKDRVDAVVRA